MEGASRRAGRRLRAHALEIAAGVAVLVVARLGGVGETLDWWVLPLLLAAAALISSWVYSLWPGDVRGSRLHVRTGSQVVALAAVAYLSGAGSALAAPVLLLAVADTVRHAGAAAHRVVLGWSVLAIVVGEVGIALGATPSLLPPAGSHAVAGLAATAVVGVGVRIVRLESESERARDTVAREAARTRALLEHASDVTLVIADGAIVYQSPSTERMLGFGPDELTGQRYLDLVHPDDRPAVIEFVRELISEPYATGLVGCRLRARDGRWVPVESSCRNLIEAPHVGGVVVNIRDVTERHELERALEHRAFHDDLTGLANRTLLLERIRHAAVRGERSGARFAVLYVDLDGFKPVNDTYGHTTGDAVLRAAARRLAAVVRDEDTVARLGGDEFAVLLEDAEAGGATDVAHRLLTALREPVTVEGLRIRITASIGIAWGDESAAALDVLRNADIAMYRAKRHGPDDFAVFEDEMHAAVAQRLRLETDLQRALEQDELVLHYQPLVRLTDQRVVGLEALVRWRHPERGLVSPAEFVPVAEQTGQIVPIGRWVLREACRQLSRWREELAGADRLVIGVNVSMRQLFDIDLVEEVRDACREAGLHPQWLALELTESALAHDATQAREILLRLKELGTLLCLDDFGTGYSSLSYLHRFPVDVLKIDRSFVRASASRHDRRRTLVRAMLDLGRALDLRVVAEGIEEVDELERFRELGCPLGQGYLFARPADAAATTALLRCLLTAEHSAGAITGMRSAGPHAAPATY